MGSRLIAAIVASAWASPVLAQPPPPAPVPITAAVESTSYPLALTERPLLMPAGGFELFGILALGLQEIGGLDGPETLETVVMKPGIRYGIGSAEVAAGLDLLVHQGEIEGVMFTNDDPLTRLFAGARFEVSPELAVGGELAITGPTTDFKVFSPRATLANKQHFGRGAVELGVAAGLDHRPAQDMFELPSRQAMVLAGQLRVQGQVTPVVAVEARATMTYFNVLDDDEGELESSPSYFVQQSYGLRALGSVTPDLDVIGEFEVLASGEGNYKIVSIGVAYRRVP